MKIVSFVAIITFIISCRTVMRNDEMGDFAKSEKHYTGCPRPELADMTYAEYAHLAWGWGSPSKTAENVSEGSSDVSEER